MRCLVNIISNLLNTGKFFKLFFRKLGRVWSLHGVFTLLEWVARALDRIQLVVLTWQWEPPLLIVVHFQLILTLPLGGRDCCYTYRNSLGLRCQHSARPSPIPLPVFVLQLLLPWAITKHALGTQQDSGHISKSLRIHLPQLYKATWTGFSLLPPVHFEFGLFSGMRSDGIQWMSADWWETVQRRLWV